MERWSSGVLGALLVLSPVLAHSAEFDPQPGWKTVSFPELPAPKSKPAWMKFGFRPEKESFEIYIPRTLQPDKPAGALGWIDPTDDGVTPHKFETLFDEFQLVAISAKRCGNNEQTDRRIGLLVSGLLALNKMITINGQRCVLSGLSGGGRAAATGCFALPEFWRGAISWCGGNYYEDYPTSKQPGKLTVGINHYKPERISPELVTTAKRNCNFALITGPRDMNLENSRDIETVMKKNDIKVMLIEEPGLGHAVGSEESMRQALEFVLGKSLVHK